MPDSNADIPNSIPAAGTWIFGPMMNSIGYKQKNTVRSQFSALNIKFLKKTTINLQLYKMQNWKDNL